MTKKRTVKFDIERFITTIKNAYRSWDAPVVTLVSNRGGSPFDILVSTILSLRTKDEVTVEATDRILEKANTPEKMVKLSEETIAKLIYPVGFYPTKAKQLIKISQILIEQYCSEVPADIDKLLELPGVGRKTANLVLIEGFGLDAVCVDTHVHRISNRIGYVNTKTADKTEFALRKKLPRKHWIYYNEMLVAFGQVICRPISPWCSRCPVEEMCPKIGVAKSR